MIDKLFAVIQALSEKLSWGSLIIMPAMMLLVTLDVALRYFFSAPIEGAQVIEGFMFLFVSFCSLSYCWIKDGHIRMRLFFSYVRPKAQACLDGLAAACGAFLFTILAWCTAKEAILAKEVGAVPMGLDLPEYPFYISMAVLSAIFALQLLLSLVVAILRVIRG